MTCQLPLLRKVRQALLTGSSYSTIRAYVVLLVLMFFTINCGPLPKGQYEIPETANAEKTTTIQAPQSAVNLPKFATVDVQKLPYVRNAFKRRPDINSRNALDNFHTMTRRTTQHSAVIANCSFDILKAFVAKGWTPIVMVRLEGRTPIILPLSEYDDQSSMVTLQNPTDLIKRQFTYKDFETSWIKSSRNKCVLITPKQLTEQDVQKVLGTYLPPDAFQQISMRSR